MLKIITKSLVFLLLFQLFANQVVSAQKRDDLTRELQRLEREIERVGSVVALFNHEKATELVLRAKQLYDEAVDDAQNKRFAAAEIKIRAAFALLERAAKIAIDTFTGTINRLRSRLLELLRKADYLISKSNNKDAERLLNQAKKNQLAADDAVSAMKYARALEHFRVAVNLAEQCIKMLEKSPSNTTDVILDEKRKYENLLERAREIIENSQNSQAKQTYQNALIYAKDAENSYRNGRIVLARKLFNQSILLLLRAMDLASATTPAATDQTTDKFYRLRDMISQSRDEILQSNKPRAKLLFDRAVNLLNEAESAAREGRNQEAIWKVELAETFLRRAQRIIQTQPNEQLSDKITQEIANTKSDIATLRGEVDTDTSMDVQILLRMAEFSITKAEQAAN